MYTHRRRPLEESTRVSKVLFGKEIFAMFADKIAMISMEYKYKYK